MLATVAAAGLWEVRAARVAPRSASPSWCRSSGATLLPAVYYFLLPHFDASWELGQANYEQPLDGMLTLRAGLALAPLLIPALLAYRRRPMDFQERILWLWAPFGLALCLAPPTPVRFHALNGLSIPLGHPHRARPCAVRGASDRPRRARAHAGGGGRGRPVRPADPARDLRPHPVRPRRRLPERAALPAPAGRAGRARRARTGPGRRGDGAGEPRGARPVPDGPRDLGGHAVLVARLRRARRPRSRTSSPAGCRRRTRAASWRTAECASCSPTATCGPTCAPRSSRSQPRAATAARPCTRSGSRAQAQTASSETGSARRFGLAALVTLGVGPGRRTAHAPGRRGNRRAPPAW